MRPIFAALKTAYLRWFERSASLCGRVLIWTLCIGLWGIGGGIGLTGCTFQGMSPTAVESSAGRIVLGTTASVSTLDPADAYTNFAGELLYNLGDRLYGYALGSDRLEPQLATALPKVSPNGLVYTIPLRPGVVFHDGSNFDAKAMAFSLNRFIQNGGGPSFLLADLVESATATGPLELTIQLKKPFTAFPSLLAFSGACAISPQAYEIKEGAFKPDTFVGTGPYRLVKFGADSIRLEAFEQYWGGQPANAGVDIQVFSNSANLFNAFRVGAVDVAYQSLALEQVRKLQSAASAKGWQVLEKPSTNINYLSVNVQSPPLNQTAVRQALAALIDRPLIRDRVFQRQVEPLYSLIPQGLGGSQPSFQQAYGDGDTTRVRQLLNQAGYSEQNPLKLDLWYRSNLVNDQLTAITLKALAKKSVGQLVQLNLNGVDSNAAYKNLDKGNGVYPLLLLDVTPDFLDPDSCIQPFLECTEGSAEAGCKAGASFSQGSFYYSPAANQLIDQSRKELNPTKRQQIFAELQRLTAEDVPFIPLWQSKDYLFVQAQVSGASLEVTKKVPLWTLSKAKGG
jgi:peptide/nickel transport system substrate-binding protein